MHLSPDQPAVVSLDETTGGGSHAVVSESRVKPHVQERRKVAQRSPDHSVSGLVSMYTGPLELGAMSCNIFERADR